MCGECNWNSPYKVTADDPNEQHLADGLSALLNSIHKRASDSATRVLTEGFHPPKYSPYDEPIKFARHIQWQQFFRSKRKDAST
jgi:hypothetical protein